MPGYYFQIGHDHFQIPLYSSSMIFTSNSALYNPEVIRLLVGKLRIKIICVMCNHISVLLVVLIFFEVGRACSTHQKDEKCIQNFGWKIYREETT
jgi:hypothetical protein